MFIGDNKLIKVLAIITFTIACIVFTTAVILSYFTQGNLPPIRAVIFILLFGLVAVISFFYYSHKK